MGDLEVEFHQHYESSARHTVNSSGRQPMNQVDATTMPREVYMATEEDLEKIREMEELQVLIDDPVRYEEQVIQEHLEGAGLDGGKWNDTENRGS